MGHCLITSTTPFHSVFSENTWQIVNRFLLQDIVCLSNLQTPLYISSGCGALSSFLFQDRFLAYGPEQHPIVLHIGGNNLKTSPKQHNWQLHNSKMKLRMS